MKAIRTILVEDHPLFRQGLRRVADRAPQVDIVAELNDGEQLLAKVQQLQPDIVIMDVNLPNQNGIQLCRTLKQKFPDLHVVILTAYTDDEQQLHAIRAGASAFFAKHVDPDVLVASLPAIQEGNYVISGIVMKQSQVAAWLLAQSAAYLQTTIPGSELPMSPLSSREMEVLEYVTRGYSNKEVALHLGISRQTVKNHMTAILRKLNCNDRTQAAVYALRNGWIRLQDTKYDR